jgi:hypothetical protein
MYKYCVYIYRMKLYYILTAALCFSLTSCNLKATNGGASKSVGSKFVGVWQNGSIVSVEGHKPRISDTSITKDDFLIIRKIAASKDSFQVSYIFGSSIFATEDSNTITHDLRPVLNDEMRIKYVDSTHIIYDWEENNPHGDNIFTKMKN